MRRVHSTNKEKTPFCYLECLGCSKLLGLDWLSWKFPKLARKKLSMLDSTF